MQVSKTLAAAAMVLGVGAGSYGIASAASGTTTTTTTTTPSAAAPSIPAHGSTAHESAETAVTGDAASKAQAAAVASVGSGTAGDVTTDFGGNGYEVTVTKFDGSTVEVHLDSSFNVVAGHGGGRGHGGQRSDETAMTGDTLDKVTAVAKAHVSGGTVVRAETDGDGNAKYEVHMTDANGDPVTVYVDASFNYVSTESGPTRP